MGLFTSKYALNEEVSLLTDETIFEYNQEVTAETGYILVAEAEENWNSIMKAVGIHELNVLEETGSEMVYEASDAGSFIDKLKDFFKMIWDKIVAVFKKFFATLDSFVRSDKDFVKKYKKDLLAKDGTDNFKFKGFKYSVDAVSVEKARAATEKTFKAEIFSTYSNSTPARELESFADAKDIEAINTAFEKKDEAIEKARGAIVGQSALDAKEFGEELSKLLRSGEETKEEYTLGDFGGIEKILRDIEGAEKAKKEAKKEYDNIKKVIDGMIKKLDNWKKEIKDADGKKDETATAKMAALASKYAGLLKNDLGLLQIVNSAKLQALKEENRQNKAICVKLLTYKKPKNESVTHYSESGSFLDSVVLR